MAITGTILAITPRWLLAAPGVLVAAYGRVSASARGRMRVTGRIALESAVRVTARLRRRVLPAAVAVSAAVSAVARNRRRVIPSAVQSAGAVTATARNRRRVIPSAARCDGKVSASFLVISPTFDSAAETLVNSAGDTLVTYS